MKQIDFLNLAEKRPKRVPPTRIPRLPTLLDRKIYKTGQTRGADDDEIFQNRVSRNSTVLIPYRSWPQCCIPSPTEQAYENGYIVLISPDDYFSDPDFDQILAAEGLAIGTNSLVFYETRAQWQGNNPDLLEWVPATSRLSPLGGQYVARVAATTAVEDGGKINRGFTATNRKGAGFRVFEYASTAAISQSRLQLEALFWLCADADAVSVENGMAVADVRVRKAHILSTCDEAGLLDMSRLESLRMVDPDGRSTCPLCLLELSSQGFFDRMAQAEGRAVHDLTITQLNLFHTISRLHYPWSNRYSGGLLRGLTAHHLFFYRIGTWPESTLRESLAFLLYEMIEGEGRWKTPMMDKQWFDLLKAGHVPPGSAYHHHTEKSMRAMTPQQRVALRKEFGMDR